MPASITAASSAVPASRSSRKRRQISYVDDDSDDDAAYHETLIFKKRKPIGEKEVVDLTADNDKPKKSPKKKAKVDEGKGEEKAPASLSRKTPAIRIGIDEAPEEKVIMAGSTGNLYTQHIRHVPSCDCPHAKKGNQCKHIVYVMLRVLKAPEQVAYQLALTSSELRDLFKNAAPIPNVTSSADYGTDAEIDGNRKAVEGECPICYTEFEPGKEAIVYCKAACGNNVHKDCMQSWMAAKSGKATCPYCRAQWEQDDVGSFEGKVDLKIATRSEEGYVNIASQLGLSGERDHSTYHQPWVRGRFGGSRYRYGRRY
ncbi:hypothetical protein N0V90_008203 [Kalmusia sp. IMI 367209]|nr:hypothetical protein N0V90_008203 [Kalmusia sp. IMI 367209]